MGDEDEDRAGIDVPRVLGRVEAGEPGPTLILIGGIHGNEPAGVLALQRLLPKLAADPTGIDHGRVVGLAGNRRALRVKKRYLDYDLNRNWTAQSIAELRAAPGPLDNEDAELYELEREIETLRAEADDTVYILDLHTTSSPELAFALLDDTLPSRRFVFALPVPVVLGLEEELPVTLESYMTGQGVIAGGFEAGQHDDPRSVDRAEAAIWIALEAAGVLTQGRRPEVAAARRRLKTESADRPHVVEVRYRHPVAPEDWFRMDPGYVNFQPIVEGQHLGIDRGGPVRSPMDGLILMPLYQAQGSDGFFIVRPIRPLWLKVSAVLRRYHFERVMHWLPGVERHPELPQTFIVDRRTARWLARELFHLLGFVRHSQTDRYLVVTRRAHDRPQDAAKRRE